MTGPAGAGSSLVPDAVRGSLVLVRHGESTYVAQGRFQGRQDPPLSALGERQAALAGAWLAAPSRSTELGLPDPPLEIVHSPLVRAARSATLIATAFEEAVGPDARPALRAEPALVEVGQGRWEGLRHDEVERRWGQRLAAWRARPTRSWAPGGERLSAADRRVRSGLPALVRPLAAAPGGWSIVVAHDGILRILLLALLDIPLDRFWAFPFGLGAASVVDLAAGRASLRAHNASAHLASASGEGGAAVPDRQGAL